MAKSRTSGTDAPIAPVSPFRVERQGSQTEPVTRRFPQVRGGVCEFCGILDRDVPSQFQYKLCQHFRGLELRCSYCDETKDPDDVNGHAILNIAAKPGSPNELVVWCNSYECSRKHEARFKVSA